MSLQTMAQAAGITSDGVEALDQNRTVVYDYIYSDKRIDLGAQVLLFKILALCTKEGFCWAGNDYFSTLFVVSVDTITRRLQQLEKAGYIRMEHHYRCQTGTRRHIFVVNLNPAEAQPAAYQDFSSVETVNISRIGVSQNCETPIRKGAETPIRKGAETPIRKGAETPIRKGAETPIRKGAALKEEGLKEEKKGSYKRRESNAREPATAMPTQVTEPAHNTLSGIHGFVSEQSSDLPEAETLRSAPALSEGEHFCAAPSSVSPTVSVSAPECTPDAPQAPLTAPNAQIGPVVPAKLFTGTPDGRHREFEALTWDEQWHWMQCASVSEKGKQLRTMVVTAGGINQWDRVEQKMLTPVAKQLYDEAHRPPPPSPAQQAQAQMERLRQRQRALPALPAPAN